MQFALSLWSKPFLEINTGYRFYQTSRKRRCGEMERERQGGGKSGVRWLWDNTVKKEAREQTHCIYSKWNKRKRQNRWESEQERERERERGGRKEQRKTGIGREQHYCSINTKQPVRPWRDWRQGDRKKRQKRANSVNINKIRKRQNEGSLMTEISRRSRRLLWKIPLSTLLIDKDMLRKGCLSGFALEITKLVNWK